MNLNLYKKSLPQFCLNITKFQTEIFHHLNSRLKCLNYKLS